MRRQSQVVVVAVLLATLAVAVPVAGAAPAAALPSGQSSLEVRVPNFAFDPLAGGEPALSPSQRFDGQEAGLRLVQLIGPTRDSWLAGLRGSGLKVLQYYPHYTYLVWGPAPALRAADTLSYVRWTGNFHPAYKINSNLAGRSGVVKNVDILFYNDGKVGATQEALVRLGAKIIQVYPAQPDRAFFVALAELDASAFEAVSRLNTVLWLGYSHPEPILDDEMSDQIQAGNHPGGVPVTGYNAHLGTLGVTGAGVRWATIDTGVDYDHPDLGPSIVAGYSFPGACNPAGQPGSDCSGGGHGTHVTGIIGGDAAAGYADANGFLYGLGVAPGYDIVALNSLSSAAWPPAGGWQEHSKQALLLNAIGGNNSWTTGEGTNHGYQASERTHDFTVHDGNFDTPAIEPFIQVFSAGNSGPSPSTLTAPKEAKNLIVVASSVNYRAGNINNISSFSSRGPAVDGRIVPTVAAPGEQISSSRNDLGGSCATAIAGTNNYYAFCSGTSMAAPHVSGAVALATQWWRSFNSGANPSPAMAKALLVNSAVDMGTPDIPNIHEGWGRVNITKMIQPDVNVVYWDQTHIFGNSGEQWSITVGVQDPAKPLKVTLAWTDAPGAVGANPALVNNLNLTVVNGANTYLGNVFSAGWSATGGTADAINNLENVFIQSPAGSATIIIDAANIAGDGVFGNADLTDQNFALVCQNCVLAPDFAMFVSPASQSICTPTDALYTVNVGSIMGYTDPVTLSAAGNPAGTTTSFSTNPVTPGGSSTLTIGNTGAAAAGSYPITVTGTSTTGSKDSTVELVVYTGTPAAPTLTTPTNGATNVSTTPTFTWSGVAGAASYSIQVATDAGFTNIVASASGLASPTWTSNVQLAPSTLHHWRVQAVNTCGAGAYSAVFTFTTAAIICNPTLIDIPSSGAATPYPSNITVTGQGPSLTNVKVHLLGMNHTFPDDIDILLVGPGGQNLIIMSDAGGSNDLVNVNLIFDDAAAGTLPDSTQIVSGSYKPTNYGAGDTFPAPAPTPSTATTLATFVGSNPNGTWSLYVVDDLSGDTGNLSGGWCLEISSTTVGPPNINVTPASLASTQAPNTSTDHTLNIGNTGGSDLTWSIAEEPALSRPVVMRSPGAIPAGGGTTPELVARQGASEASSGGVARDDVGAPSTPGVPAPTEKIDTWLRPLAVLWDNGPLVTHPGGGAGGADESRVQNSSLGMTTLGFGHQVSSNNWVADDFTVSDPAGWLLDTAVFFAYQTGSGTTSTITNVNWVVYNGDPSAGGTAVASGSGLVSSVWSNIYRTSETTIGDTSRPIMATTVSLGGLYLPAGTYWLAWQAAGSLASGPWAPPITILGQTTTGNGLQFLGSSASWGPANDGGTATRQGLPFILTGQVGAPACSNPANVPWLSAVPTNGTTAGGASTPVTVTMNSTGLSVGVYEANLCVTSNDPDTGPGNGTNLVVVPVTLTVSAISNPAITLTKTVGTTSGVCATTSAITVPPGTTVYYCYEVTNTGNVALSLHDLADSELGPIFAGANYALAPGASVNTVTLGVTVSAVINTTTTNTATWTAYNAGPSDVATATASATVTVQANPNIDVDPLTLAATQAPDTTSTQTLNIANTGTGTLSWQVLEEPVTVPSPGPLGPPLGEINFVADPAAESEGHEQPAGAPLLPSPPGARRLAMQKLYTTGLLLVPDSTNDRIMALDPTTGNVIDANFVPSNAVVGTGINAILNAAGDRILLSDQTGDVVHQFDLDGNYLGIFAPAGGPNTAILDNIRGISLRPNGNLLVTVAAGANTNSVAEFDTAGNYLGNFIAAASGGLGSPWDPYGRSGDWLVTGSAGTTGALRYDLAGAFLNVFAPISTFPEQVGEAANGNVLVANFSPSTNEGVLEYTSTGTFVGRYDPTGLSGYRGVYELPDGTILTTTGAGVHQIDRSGNLVENKVTGVSARFIEYVVIETTCTTPTDVPWLSTAPSSGATAGGATTPVTVTFDSTGLAVGVYNANLCVLSNDPDPGPGNGTELVVVPVSLTVEEPQLPSISLAKTVGTAPAVCATTDAITVPAGTTVYYCYEVTNTGNVTLNLHDLVDSELGTIFSGFSYPLIPGASAYLVVDTVINVTTTNTATWTAYNAGPSNVVTAEDSATVTVAVPSLACNGPVEEFELGVPPVGWSVMTNEPSGPQWTTLAGCGEAGNYTNGSGGVACVSSDLFGQAEMDTSLVTPAFSLAGFTSASLTYTANYQNFANLDFLDVDISTDGGTTWTNLLSWNEDHGAFRATPGEDVVINLSAYAGQSGLRLRFRYHDPNTGDYNWYAQVDNVGLTCGQQEPPNIDVDPLSLAATQPPNTTTSQTLDIGNTGGADLTWAIDEAPASPLVQLDDRLRRQLQQQARRNLRSAPAVQAGSRAGASSGVVGPPPIAYESPADFSEGFDDITLLPGLGWYFQNNSSPLGLTDWFQGNDSVFPAHAGAPTAYIGANFNNTSGAGTISNWMLTPQLTLANGDTFSFWTRTATGSIWPDRLQVRLSLAGASTNVGSGATDVGDFTTLLLDINPSLTVGGYPEVWTQYTITLSGIPPAASGRIAFRYFVENAGPSGTNSNYIGIDTVEFISAATPGPCDAPADVPWLSVLPANGTTAGGATTPVTVTFDSTGLAVGVYNANLCVLSNDPDPGPGNGTELVVVPVSLTVEIPQVPAISLAKTVGTTPGVCAATSAITVTEGTTVYYCYEVTNTGNVALNLHDLVDSELGTIFTGLNHALAPGASVNTVAAGLTISSVINVTTTNTATWTAYNAGPTNVATASASATVTVTRNPAIAITKTVGTTPGVCAATSAITVTEGTTVYYCVTVTNTGDVTLRLHDLVDSELGTIFTGLNHALAPGASVNTVTLGVTISSVITVTTTNTVTWTAYNAGPTDVATASASATVTVTRNPAIAITKTVGTTPGVCAATSTLTVLHGTTVYYCVTVENTGDVTLRLHDLVDDRLGTIFTGFNYALAPGASVDTVTAGVTMSATLTATTTNTAIWTAYNAGPSDSVTASASATVTVLVPANVTGTKTVAGTFSPMGTVTYTIVLSNAGPGVQPDNPGDEFIDTIPAQLTATAVGASSGTAALVGNTVTWNGSIPAGGSVTITVAAVVNYLPGGTVVSNQGTIFYDAGGDGSNSGTRLTDDPGVPGAADPTDFVVIALEPIPTLQGVGLATLILLLGVVAVLALRRMS